MTRFKVQWQWGLCDSWFDLAFFPDRERALSFYDLMNMLWPAFDFRVVWHNRKRGHDDRSAHHQAKA